MTTSNPLSGRRVLSLLVALVLLACSLVTVPSAQAASNSTVSWNITGQGSVSATYVNNGVRVSYSEGASLNKGAVVTLTMAPAAGWAVKTVTASGGGANLSGSGNVWTTSSDSSGGDVTVSITFEITSSSVAFSVPAGNGTVSATFGGVAYTSGADLGGKSKTVVLTLAPNTGYITDTVTVSNGTVTGSGNSWTVTTSASGGPAVVVVAFKGAPGCTVTTSVVGSGTITPSGAVNVPVNGTQAFTMLPSSNTYMISDVVLDAATTNTDLGAAGSYDFTCTSLSSHTLRATFVPRATYQVYVAASVASGTCSGCTVATTTPAQSTTAPTGSPAQYPVLSGLSQTFVITPGTGFTTTGPPQVSPHGTNIFSSCLNFTDFGTYQTCQLIYVQQNMDLRVTFAPTETISAWVPAGGHGRISPANTPSTSSSGTPVKIAYGQNASFSILPDSGYVVDTITVDGTTLHPTDAGFHNPYVFNAVTTSTHTITATFVAGGAAMSAYCNIPPFISSGLKPNLLLLIDNSASMYDLAYNKADSFCRDDTFNNSASYEGYFDQDSVYSFDGSKFAPYASALPQGSSSCTYGGSTGYVCVHATGTVGTVSRVADTFVATGKFLNWLSASKLDVEKKVLTGGKYTTLAAAGVLQAESRGCLGRRFAKQIHTSGTTGTIEGVTFSVRGPNAFGVGSGSANPTSGGGLTSIEIYEGNPFAGLSTECASLMTAWTTGTSSFGDLSACAGFYDTGATGHGQQHKLYSTVVGNCNSIAAAIAAGTNPMSVIDPSQAKIHCGNSIRQNGGSTAFITDPYGAYGVCGSDFTHAFMNGNNTGYMGKCLDSSGNWPSDDTCVKTEIMDYCQSTQVGNLTDPSFVSVNTTTGTVTNPAYIVEGLVDSLPLLATYPVYVSVSAPPTKLIDEFKDQMRIGVMDFNYAGSKSETAILAPKYCSVNHDIACYFDTDCPATEQCIASTPTDGGHVLAAISDSVGNHSAGLVKTIDDIAASSWTPHSEAFFSAIGYFAPVKRCGGTGIVCYADADCTGSQCMLSGSSVTSLTVNNTAFATDLSGTGSAANWYNATQSPMQYVCQNNYIMLITDGMSTADRNPTVNSLVTSAHTAYDSLAAPAVAMPASSTSWIGATTTNPTGLPQYYGSYNLDDLAWLAKHRNIANFDKPINYASDAITTYVVYTGEPCPAYDASGYCTSTDEGVPEKMMQMTALKGGGVTSDGRLATYFPASDPSLLESGLRTALSQIASKTNSGTAASILSNSEGSGANILQAVFFPQKSFDSGSTTANWLGELHNLWYYVDPFINKSTVRENTSEPASALANTRYFNLKSDYELRFNFDPVLGQTTVDRYEDANGDGIGDNYISSISTDRIKSLWRAGLSLWGTPPADRRIYTQTDGANLTGFDNTGDSTMFSSVAANQALLNVSAGAAPNIVSFVRGTDFLGTYRTRNIKAVSLVSGNYQVSAGSNVWKLGDIISSTPRVQSTNRTNSYDLPPAGGYNDLSYQGFVNSANYLKRGMVYAGANDGMLHAFKLGTLSTAVSGDQLSTLSGTNLGSEQWAFIPKNVLPYLQYLADPNYTHIYTVDGPTVLADVSIGSVDASNAALPGCTSSATYYDCSKKVGAGWRSDGANWRSILIGSMGYGGASKNSTTSGTGDFVKTPILDVGYSSYFGLDITNQYFDSDGTMGDPARTPSLLWEFSDPSLGYATSGPALIKISAKKEDGVTPDTTKNGHWFAVFASGPTGPIEGNACQFKGKSDQPVKLFIFDLTTGPVAGHKWTIDTTSLGITNGFAGVISNGVVDTDRWNNSSPGFYQDNVLYIPYTYLKADGVTWDGGILRLLTKEDPNPGNWTLTKVIDGVGPITTNVTKLQDRKRHNLWLYFGSGRYFYNQDDLNPAERRRIYGIKEPCYQPDTLDPVAAAACAAGSSGTLSFPSDLTDQSADTAADALNLVTGNHGWSIDLSGQDTAFNLGAERVITDPVAMVNGGVFFTTFMPSTDPCSFGGKSYMWGVKFDTGAQAPTAALRGKALVQVSTGNFAAVDLSTSLTARGYRRMGTGLIGKPPSDPPPVISNSNNKPLKRILHIQER